MNPLLQGVRRTSTQRVERPRSGEHSPVIPGWKTHLERQPHLAEQEAAREERICSTLQRNMALCTMGGKDLRDRANDQLAALRLWSFIREQHPENSQRFETSGFAQTERGWQTWEEGEINSLINQGRSACDN